MLADHVAVLCNGPYLDHSTIAADGEVYSIGPDQESGLSGLIVGPVTPFYSCLKTCYTRCTSSSMVKRKLRRLELVTAFGLKKSFMGLPIDQETDDLEGPIPLPSGKSPLRDIRS